MHYSVFHEEFIQLMQFFPTLLTSLSHTAQLVIMTSNFHGILTREHIISVIKPLKVYTDQDLCPRNKEIRLVEFQTEMERILRSIF